MKNSIIYKLIVICIIFCVLSFIVLLLGTVGGFFWFLLLVAVPIVVLTIWVILYIKKRIIAPLVILTREANNISSGDLSHEIAYKRDDEIGRFVSAFDHMRSELYERQEQQRQFEIERKNFINSISHDLKTPIASISAHIEALQDEMAATLEEEKQYFKVIENKLTILTELSNQLSLSYATPDTLHLALQDVNCGHWTSDFFDDMRTECQIHGIVPGLKNLIEVDNKAVICIDIYQFDRALQNISSNVFRYTKGFFSISAEISEQYFLLRIENDGVTLPADHVGKIFDRFYTEETGDAQGHLGLGLYITKTIIQAMKGNVQAKIQSGRIIFEVALPIS